MDLVSLTRDELNEEFLRVHRKWLSMHSTLLPVDPQFVEFRVQLDAIIVEMQKRRAARVFGKETE